MLGASAARTGPGGTALAAPAEQYESDRADDNNGCDATSEDEEAAGGGVRRGVRFLGGPVEAGLDTAKWPRGFFLGPAGMSIVSAE